MSITLPVLMSYFNSTSLDWIVLAQAEHQGPNFSALLPMFLVIIALFYVMVILPQRREQNQRKGMLDDLKKNDHVVTTGGIHGIVTNVRRDDDEVMIKVDESNNTKLRVSIGSIARVVTNEDKDE